MEQWVSDNQKVSALVTVLSNERNSIPLLRLIADVCAKREQMASEELAPLLLSIARKSFADQHVFEPVVAALTALYWQAMLHENSSPALLPLAVNPDDSAWVISGLSARDKNLGLVEQLLGTRHHLCRPSEAAGRENVADRVRHREVQKGVDVDPGFLSDARNAAVLDLVRQCDRSGDIDAFAAQHCVGTDGHTLPLK